MNNHFGKGLMAGLHAPYAYSAHHAVNFCSEYKRGFVLRDPLIISPKRNHV